MSCSEHESGNDEPEENFDQDMLGDSREDGGFSEEPVIDVFPGHFENLESKWPNVASKFDSILSLKWDKRGTKMYDISSVLPFLHNFGKEKNNRAFNMSKVVSYL